MTKKTSERQLFSKLISFILLYFPFFLFSILILLTFFWTPVAEDLAIHYYSKSSGIFEFIKEFYLKSGSRYFSFPLVTIICHSRFMLEHYWILPLSLLLVLYIVLRKLVESFTRLLSKPISSKWISWLGMMLLLALSSAIPEMNSFFYWISGSYTYLLSFILFILFGLIFLQVEITTKHKKIYLFVAVLLVVCIAGCNEIATYFLILFLIWAQCLFYSVQKKANLFLLICLITILFCVAFLILPSGVAHRAGNYGLNFSFFRGLLVSVGYTVRGFFHVCSAAFVWITMALATLAGFHTPDHIKSKLKGKVLFDPRFLFSMIFIAVLLFYFIIYVFSGELLAPRAHNLITVFISSFILICCYSYGFRSTYVSFSAENTNQQSLLKIISLTLIITSSFTVESVYNVFAGVIHNRVIKERMLIINSAHRYNSHAVSLQPYSKDFAEQSRKVLPHFVFEILKKKIVTYPDWLNFQDPVQDTVLYIHYFAEFHHIDTIWYMGTDYKRIGLMLKTNQK